MSPVRLAPLLLLTACLATTPGSDRVRGEHRVTGPRDPITEAEIARSNAADAYDVVRSLRGSMLATRGITTMWKADGGAYPVVFVDGMYVGPLSELRSIPARSIHEVLFLGAAEAHFRYGSGYTAGVIDVTTKR